MGIPDKHLPVFKLNQRIVDLIHHGNFSDARFGFWGGYVVLYPSIVLQTVNQCVIDLGPYGIRSNVVLPGTIKTQRWVEMGNKQIVNGELTPIGDISDFEDIANAAWYLGSDQSKNVTGTEVTVDGGMTCQLYPQILNDLKRAAQK